jgi:predicted XRE-type DNA-binding protein
MERLIVTCKRILVVLNLFALLVIATSCAKGPKEEGGVGGSTIANANQQEVLAKTPHLSSMVRGDIERIGMAVQSARDSLQQNKWVEVVSYLQGANREVTAALADTPEKKKTAVVRQNLEELKVAIERTIKTAELRNTEAQSQVNELQTRVNALKVNASQ